MELSGNSQPSLGSPRSRAAPAGGSLWVDLLGLVAVWAAVYLTHLGTRELRLEEPHRVEPALAMVESGNWAVPLGGGEPYYRKPPFFNWLIAASFQVTGRRNELTARLPSAVMMLLLALTVYGTSRSWLGRRGAFGAALLGLTASAMIDKGRLAEIDATYAALTGMACAVWLAGWARRRLSAGRLGNHRCAARLGPAYQRPAASGIFPCADAFVPWPSGSRSRSRSAAVLGRCGLCPAAGGAMAWTDAAHVG